MEGVKHLLLNVLKDLDINRFSDMHKYCNGDFFLNMVAEWMKEELV